MRRLLGGLAGLLVAAAVVPAGAQAATTRSDTLVGTEVAFTSTEGTFVGTASGALPGAWKAVIDHTPLSPGATITGGTFTLATVMHLVPTTVSGRFASGGTVTRTASGAGCTNQVYAVNDRLVHVGVGGGSGTGRVSATLTHLRASILGFCLTYGATVRGTVTLTF